MWVFVNRDIERKCEDTLWIGVSFYFYKKSNRRNKWTIDVQYS